MTPAASEAMARAREILGYRREPARGWWDIRLTPDERRRALERVGFVIEAGGYAARPWDGLPGAVQDGLRMLHDKARAVYMRLKPQFDGGGHVAE